MRYVYPARLTDHPETVIVTFRDWPEAITEGADRSAAIAEAHTILDAAIRFRLKEGEVLPEPSRPEGGEVMVAASPSVAAKAAFVRAFRESGLTRVALGARLGLHEGEVRRMLDPAYATKLDRLDAGLKALGRRLILADEAA